MTQSAVAIGVMLAVAGLTGCSASPRSGPHAQAPSDVLETMKSELDHSFARLDAFDAMDDELSHAIGTTRLTSDVVTSLPQSAPAVEPKALRTWGAPEPEADPVTVLRTWGAPTDEVDALPSERPR